MIAKVIKKMKKAMKESCKAITNGGEIKSDGQVDFNPRKFENKSKMIE